MEKLITLCERIKTKRHPESWINFSDAIGMSFLLAAFFVMADFLCIVAYPKIFDEVAHPFIPKTHFLIEFISFFVGILVLWRIGFSIYWRSGKGEKIAVCYNGDNIPMSSWIYSKRHISSLIKRNEIQDAISLKLIPKKFMLDNRTWLKYKVKYNFSILFEVIPTNEIKSEKPILKYSIISTYSKLSKDYIEATVRHSQKLCAVNKSMSDVHELQSFNANNMFKLLMLWAGLYFFSQNKFYSADAVLWSLDKNIKNDFRFDEYPRKAIRYLDAICLIMRNLYPGNDVPDKNKLITIIQEAEKPISRFKYEFPFVLNHQARNYYFLGDIDKAITLTDDALEHCEQNQPTYRSTLLNRGVLSLFKAEYVNAVKYLQEFVNRLGKSKPDFDDLIVFADEARKRFESAVVLQVLYRKLGSTVVPKPLKQEAEMWLSKDKSRLGLKILLNNARGFQSPPQHIPSKALSKEPKRKGQ
jgi:tetratricopeptide (TPR) repeat protein